MRYLYYLLGILLLLLLFAFSSQSIIAIRLIELRYHIQKEQIMNYELSSKSLKERLINLFSQKDNIHSEIRLKILESETLNANLDSFNSTLNLWERSGYAISSLAGMLQFRKPQPILSDKEILNRLQVGFSLEKRRNFIEASNVYESLLEELDSQSEEMAFVQLHHGFCLFMVGKREDAKSILGKLSIHFPGTHYSDNANLLINLIDLSLRKRKEYYSKKLADSDLVDFYYKNGDYYDAIQVLNDKKNRSLQESYLLSRSYEEVGRIPESVQGYLKLVNQDRDRSIAIQANRRLLLIGNFYVKNESLQSLSEEYARKLSDYESVTLVNQGKSRIKSEVIMANPGKNQSYIKVEESMDQALNETIIKTIPQFNESESIILPQAKEPSVKLGSNAYLKVELNDGRTLYPTEINREGDRIQLKMKNFPILIQPNILSSIQAVSQSENSEDKMIIYIGRKKLSSNRIEIKSSDLILSSYKNDLLQEFKLDELNRVTLGQL